jgi:TolA-binding protein
MTRVQAPSSTDPEDLSVRARQGSLSESERAALERALAASQTLAVAHQVGTDFDRIGLVRSGDDELVARLADLTLESTRPRARFALGRRRLFLALAAALTVAGSAAAWRGATLLRSVPPAPSPAAPSPKPSAARVIRAKTPEAVTPPAVVAAVPEPAAVVAALPAPTVGVVSLADSERVSAPLPRATEDAAALFREAAAARRSSDFGRARLLYLRLESDFPASAEAQLARVSLGKVLLLMGRAGEAEQQFALYSSAAGALSEEALVGQAQSLARLGRASDELKVWQRLLHDFPRSVYAGEANQRLAALSAAEPR